MRLLMIVISMQIIEIPARKYVSSSDESIENLLYYKDCQHKQKGSTESPILRSENVQPTPAARQPECPFPKMCCSMSCGNECASSQSFLSRQMEPLQNFGGNPPFQPSRPPVQPPVMQRARKKKMKPSMSPLMAFGGRRDSGFTKERIKSLISQDDDIRKILKDLVRVTMQKVDLLEMINSRRNNNQITTESSADSEEYE
ncbi:hypothetical protein evm_005216 [Chilo suppressalis]|nr:hypothetical protein evm_005216 [Chilo suppressalis]